MGSSKEQASFNFMASVTICSDFGAQENKVSHCFHVSGHEFEQTLGDGERQEAWHTAARGKNTQEQDQLRV